MFLINNSYEFKFIKIFYNPKIDDIKDKFTITKNSAKSVVCDRVILEFHVQYFC